MNLNAEEQQVLYLIKTDPDHARYFFAKAKALKWFYPLKHEGYFNPDRIEFDANGNSFFWIVLDYLERVSELVTQNPQQHVEYGKELIDIINNVVQFSRNVKKINHYHIWWYCVKILNNLPLSIINANLPADTFRIWLLTWIDRSAGSELTISDVGEKLLGKFLQNDSTLQYAEVIIDTITGIRPNQKQREKDNIFSEREDAELKWDSYWILHAFQKYSKVIGQKCSVDIILALANKLKNALEYKQSNYYVDIEHGNDRYRLKIFRIILENKESHEIGFKDNSFDVIVKQFASEQLKDIDIEKDFWALHQTEPSIERARFTFQSENKETFTNSVKVQLPKEIDWSTTDKFEEKICHLFDGLHADYSHIWFKSLANGGSTHTSNAQEVLAIILRDILMAKAEANSADASRILEMFLSERYGFPIFRRLVLLCIGKFWAEYSSFFEKYLAIVPECLNDSDYEVELYDILHDHNQKFSNDLKKKLKELIENVPEYYLKKEENLAAYWKYKWLSPLKDNPDFSSAYNTAKEKAQPKDGKAYEPERSAFQGGIVVHKSPLSTEEVLKKPVAELVKYFNDFQGADFWQGTFEGEPDKEGLSEALQAAVKADPEKFTNEIESFHNVNYSYTHRLLSGLKDAWNGKKDLNWERIFDFCLAYLSQDRASFLKKAFEAQGEDSGKGKYIWIIEDIVDLIDAGSGKDDWAFDPKYFDKVHGLFDLIVPYLKGEKPPETQREALTYALNTTLGRTIRGFITFSLRISRATKQKEEHWGQNRYERFFAIGIEAYIWFGGYLPNMRYLDQAYTDEKIVRLTEISSNDSEWQMFMEGYLGASGVYKDLYSLMRPHYLKVLDNADFGDRADKRYVEHISIGYLAGWELLEPDNSDGKTSLFYKMLAEAGSAGKPDRWLEVVGFFWGHSRRTIIKEEQAAEEDAPAEVKNKIIEFWAWTHAQQTFVKSCLGDCYGSFLGRLAELTIFLDKIDENNQKWLLLSAPHVGQEHRSPFFIEYLTKFNDEESMQRIGQIYLKILENTTPSYKQENIQLLVSRLYELAKKKQLNNLKTEADSICNIYGRRGIHFLKEIWQQYQSS